MRLSIKKNDKKARTWIFLVSIIIFSAIVILGRVKLDVDLGFNEHVFATINAVINTVVSILLLCGLITARQGNYTTHKNIMLLSIALSVLFLVFYETKYGGEGSIRYIYYFILGTHIILAAIILPFILFTAYRALINENEKHRKLAKITWPVWFYVALTGPVVYLMISPYY
jgi:putative membrane protein